MQNEDHTVNELLCGLKYRLIRCTDPFDQGHIRARYQAKRWWLDFIYDQCKYVVFFVFLFLKIVSFKNQEIQ